MGSNCVTMKIIRTSYVVRASKTLLGELAKHAFVHSLQLPLCGVSVAKNLKVSYASGPRILRLPISDKMSQA